MVLWLVTYFHISIQKNLSIIVSPPDSHTRNVLPKNKKKTTKKKLQEPFVIYKLVWLPQNPGEGGGGGNVAVDTRPF